MNLKEKWSALLAEQGEVPEIATASKQQVMARIFENQELDMKNDPAYRDQELVRAFSSITEAAGNLSEAVVGGDAGYNAANIAQGTTSGAVTGIGPAVMGMVRRAIPNLIAFDVCGVQPMSGPTSQVFALRALYGKDPLAVNAVEAFHPVNAPNASFSGQLAGASIAVLPTGTALVAGTPYQAAMSGRAGEVRFFQSTGTATLTLAGGAGVVSDTEYAAFVGVSLVEIDAAMATSVAELQESFNGSSGNAWNEMSFRIDKQVVEAKSRQLKSQYSIELAQDLKAVHGMDADAELSSILSTEVMLEINREIVNLINAQAQVGKTGWTQTTGTTAGVFDFSDSKDTRGARWAGESYKSLLIQIEKEANEIARQTGRGAGNFIIATRNVVSALSMTDVFVGLAMQGMQTGALNTDTTKAVFAGILGGRFKVYIDQYATSDYVTVGFKGANEMDAGVYYCPYVALTPLRGADARNFQPVMGFKTRYGIQVNPFADPTKTANAAGKISSGMPEYNTMGRNAYFRRFWVKGL